MNQRQLRFVVTLGDTLHFGQAAADHFIAQSAFSRQIKLLEQELGVALFDRSANRVSLTPAGERFCTRARQILDTIDAAAMEAREIAGGVGDTVRIGIFGEGAAEIMPLLFAAYQQAFPRLSLHFVELSMTDQVETLVNGQVDLAILRPPICDVRVELHPLFSEPRCAVLPVDHRLTDAATLTVADLIDEPFAAAAEAAPASWSSFWRCDEGRVGAEVSSIAESLSAIAYLKLVDTFPTAAARRFPHPGVAYVPLSDAPFATVSVAHRSGDERRLVRTFCDVAGCVVREQLSVVPGAVPGAVSAAGAA